MQFIQSLHRAFRRTPPWALRWMFAAFLAGYFIGMTLGVVLSTIYLAK